MREHKGPKIVPDKVAGLQTHQFARDTNRFALPSTTAQNQNGTTGGVEKKQSSDFRRPRIGNNSKNESSDVFRFGGVWAYPDEKERYVSDVARFEKERLAHKREKLETRVDIKRNWKSEIEQHRWEKMSDDYVKEQELWKAKHARTRVGQHSVHYNPITLEYHSSDGGKKLAEADAKAMHRVATRSLKLYLKRNTFDPILGRDIPQKIDLSDQSAALVQATEGASSMNTSGAKFGRRASQTDLPPASAGETLTPYKLAQQVSNTISKLQENGVTASTPVISADVNQSNGWFRHY